MLDWILKNLYLVAVIVVFLVQIVRAMVQAREASRKNEAGRDETEEARRTRELQERIRRQIAQRRGGGSAAEAEPPVVAQEVEPPRPQPHTTQLPEPFGGPLGRMLEELQKRAQPRPVEPPPLQTPVRNTAEVERQEQLAEELRRIEEARAATARRAAQLAAAQKAQEATTGALLKVARGELLHDLRDPESLRRAFVLREVLGTPVGLR